MNTIYALAAVAAAVVAAGAILYLSSPSAPSPLTVCGSPPACLGQCDNGVCKLDKATGACGCYNCTLQSPRTCQKGTCPTGETCMLNVSKCDCMVVGGVLPPQPPDFPPPPPPLPETGWCVGTLPIAYGADPCRHHNATYTPVEVVKIEGVEYCKANSPGDMESFYFTRDFSRCIVEAKTEPLTLGNTRMDTVTRLEPAYCTEPELLQYSQFETVRYIGPEPFSYCIEGSKLTHTDYYTGAEHTVTGVIVSKTAEHCKVKVEDLGSPAQPYTAEYLLDADGMELYESWTSGSLTQTKDYRSREFSLSDPTGTNTFPMTDSDRPDCIWDFANFA